MAGLGGNNQLAKDDDRDEHLPFEVDLEDFEGEAPNCVSQVAFEAQHTLFLVE